MAATIGFGPRSMTSCTWESVGSCGGLPNSVMSERVDRRIVHGHDRDAALTVEADGLADLRHASLVWRRSGANDTRPAPALLRGADVTRGGSKCTRSRARDRRHSRALALARSRC